MLLCLKLINTALYKEDISNQKYLGGNYIRGRMVSGFIEIVKK